MGKGLLPRHTLIVIPGEYCGEMRGWRTGHAQLGPRLGPAPPGRMNGAGQMGRTGDEIREVGPPWGTGTRVGMG